MDIPWSIHQRTHDVLHHLSADFDLTALYFSNVPMKKPLPCTTLRLPRKWLFPVRGVEIGRRLKQSGMTFDVAITEGPWAGLVGMQLKMLRRAAVLIYEDLDYFPGDARTPLGKAVVIAAERLCVRRSDGVISVGHRLARLRRSQGGKVVTVIPNGADLTLFNRPRVPHRRFALVYSGSLADWSGLDLVLRSLTLLRDRIPDVRFIIAGDGPRRSTLEEIATRLRLEENVEFLGRVSYGDLPDVFAQADVGVAMLAPTDLTRPAFPLKLAEYLVAGLPVIVTADTEMGDLVEASGAGFSVPYEEDAVAQGIIRLQPGSPLHGRLVEANCSYVGLGQAHENRG